MPQVKLFRWRPGNGWLVLSGGGPTEAEDVQNIEASMLGHTLSQGPLAYIWAASDIEAADRHMDFLRDLGSRTGYLVDILTEEDDLLFRQLTEAGLIIVGDGAQREILRQGLMGTAIRGIEDAFLRGATVYVIGESAALFGAYLLESGAMIAGFNWLAQSFILPGYTADQAERLRECVQKTENGYGLGLGPGSALAFGPGNEVEVWGNAAAITVTLSQVFSPTPKKVLKRSE
ncbi:MAG: hypothetical protein HY866_10855 [Chloroflexi bacterium]|nr:hypothetical protein [Chloroflexota bacterium]